MTAPTAVALTIAGADSGAGAGIQADLKTFAAFGVYGVSAITAVTAQNTLGVRAVHVVPAAVVGAQIDAVLEDFAVAAIKIGMLADAGIAEAVAGRLREVASQKARTRPFVILDPVITASSGDALSNEGLIDSIRTIMLPLVDCLTPNLPEAAALLGKPEARDEETMIEQGRALIALGARAVLMKGGHLASPEAVDLLATADRLRRYSSKRIASNNLHGAGCTLSAAIAAGIARGEPLAEATAAAKAFVAEAIEAGRTAGLGRGRGPLIQRPWRGG
jgi:hydroxymethylpyrimidine/phosphomethylpyrimidine kinase